MFRFLSLILIFVISLQALSDSSMLDRANFLMKSGNKTDKFRAYNDYKNLYLRSIISDNKILKLDSLKGIVKSGDFLKIDVSRYKNELLSLEKIKSLKHKKSIKKIKIKSSHKLKNIGWQADRLVLEFDKKLKSKQINYFTLYDSIKKQYKYVFDIHASMLTRSHRLRKKGIQKIKFAQYNPSRLRLVIQNNNKLKIHFKLDSNKLIININNISKIKHNNIKSPIRKDRDKIIVLDAGHGGKDPGAIGYRHYREKIIVMQVAKKLQKLLKNRGYKVYMTRNTDKFIKLVNRTKYANRKKADLFVSIHANASRKETASGIECYFLSKSRSKRASRVAAKENSADISAMNRYGKQSFLNFLNHYKILASNKLAIDLQRGVLGSLNKHYKKVKDGGVREGPFWVLVGAQMPAVLVEVGFVTNKYEAKRLVSNSYQKNIATGLADGIERYFENN